MGALQVPADKLAARLSFRAALVLATSVAMRADAARWIRSRRRSGRRRAPETRAATLLVTQAYGERSRGPLGIYNFSGDLGKSIFPAMVALMLPFIAWRPVVGLTAIIGLASAAVLLTLVPEQPPVVQAKKNTMDAGGNSRGFSLLVAIGACDTATRMGYLLFLPFALHAKGGDGVLVGVSLALLFAGGALGKACCGWLGQHFGVVWSVVLTEAATALLIMATLVLPLAPVLVLLPILGVVLNGTSSVLYGTVPELARPDEVGRAFALFYTGVIGAGGLAPIAYGAIADHSNRTVGIMASALTAAATIPLVFALRPHLRAR